VIRFLDRLIADYNQPRYQPMLDHAVAWMLDNPVRTFNWQAQFDDAKLRGPYENLAKHEACDFASYLLRHADQDARKIALAEDILRFAEDQFVVWEHPPAIKARSDNLSTRNWFTPCSTEQYAMFEPISGSSAFMIIAYLRAYEATGKPIYLAKAESLANALTVAQEYHHGRYPTRMIKEDLAYWINSTVNTARAMEMLAHTRP
jgi:maltose/maltodextrin transport system substrate-binding protein